MQFPYTPKTNISHTWGGKIVAVHGIKHQECKPRDGRSLDGWWFECDVLWDDGKVSRSPVEPFKMAAEEGGQNADLRVLFKALDEYLAENGKWYDSKPHEGWYAHRKAKAAA
jgi:hypothetical protein